MRLASMCLALSVAAQATWADTNRLIDAMGIPQLIAAFSAEGALAGKSIDDTFLNGQGGDVWAETVRRLYDPARLETGLRDIMVDTLDPNAAAQALLFFEAEPATRIVEIEVQARQAFLDEAVEAAAKASPAAQGQSVTDILLVRDLIERNTAVAVDAQAAFMQGMIDASGRATDPPDLDRLRARILIETEDWLRGYNALIQSALNQDDIDVYLAFWDTNVGTAVDDALFQAFGQTYSTLSYALGQAAGRLLPQNEL